MSTFTRRITGNDWQEVSPAIPEGNHYITSEHAKVFINTTPPTSEDVGVELTSCITRPFLVRNGEKVYAKGSGGESTLTFLDAPAESGDSGGGIGVGSAFGAVYLGANCAGNVFVVPDGSDALAFERILLKSSEGVRLTLQFQVDGLWLEPVADLFTEDQITNINGGVVLAEAKRSHVFLGHSESYIDRLLIDLSKFSSGNIEYYMEGNHKALNGSDESILESPRSTNGKATTFTGTKVTAVRFTCPNDNTATATGTDITKLTLLDVGSYRASKVQGNQRLILAGV